jgi:uncharacterized protein YjbI with pentapeptide repeats
MRWLLGGLGALTVVVACVLVFPQQLIDWELGSRVRTLSPADLAKAINDVRATLLQGIGGAVVLLGAYFAYRQLQVNREGQITERFTRATDQLGHNEVDVRMGGIYALERIANDSPRDRATIAEMLTAFVRGHAAWPASPPSGPPLSSETEWPVEVPALEARAPDVQAAMSVLGRRLFPLDGLHRLNLVRVDLRNAQLKGADLREVEMFGANLLGADLTGANLQDADLRSVDFLGANLPRANLRRADLSSARLKRAELYAANLQAADLTRANLHDAYLCDADLRRAHLRGARFEGAALLGARFEGARVDAATVWPKGFNWQAVGVVTVDDAPEASNPVRS